MGQDQEVKIVIPQYGNRTVAELFDEAEHLERLRAAVDQIAGKPQAIAPRIEPDRFKEFQKFSITPLNITYRVCSHLFQCRV
jgi:hypothetical protein